jgi:hypothetical protein
MRLKISVIIILVIFCGCSGIGNIVAPDGSTNETVRLRLPQLDRWTWHTGLYRVSEDHSTVEKLPFRTADWHVNVNKLVEPPSCSHCLMVGKPQLQPDGTIKIKVILTHPFPGQPEYTGFDVRGTVIFPATRYWKREPNTLYDGNAEPVFEVFDHLYFSRAEDGGGQLLNADGFTMYLFPGLDIVPHLPITKYSKGQYANGPDPDSTINGYRLFTKDPERRMFLVTDTIGRTYHISPPEGEFIFGYVVDASWAAPTNMPVTDPATDFPIWANCEDGYVVEFEQRAPFYTGSYDAKTPPTNIIDREVTTATILFNRPQLPYSGGYAEIHIFCPDITPDYKLKRLGVAAGITNESLGYHVIKGNQKIKHGIYEATPGGYVALMFAWLSYIDPKNPNPKQFFGPPVFDFIKLQVEEGDW